MKIQFEGTLEEFSSLFGRGEMWTGEDAQTAHDLIKHGENYLQGADTPVLDFPGQNIRVLLGESVLNLPEAEVEPVPQPKEVADAASTLASIPPETRAEAWESFRTFCEAWTQGFEENTEERASLEEMLPHEPEVAAVAAGGEIPEKLWSRVTRASPEARTEKDEELLRKLILTQFERMRSPEQDARLQELRDSQPDRLQLLRELGSRGKYIRPILLMAYEEGSLQRLVERALLQSLGGSSLESGPEWFDYIERLTANMVAVSHMGFPDLAPTYDYSTKWRKARPGEKT